MSTKSRSPYPSRRPRGRPPTSRPRGDSRTRLVKAPSASSDVTSYGSASIVQMGRTARVSHTEMFAMALDGYPTFDIQYFDINPGNSILFPWLSLVAQAYEKYSFQSIDIHYIPSCGTATYGVQGVYFDSDSTDEAVSNLFEAADQRKSIQGPAWASNKLHLDHVTLRGPVLERYIYLGTDLTSARDNYCGQIFIFAGNGASGVIPGRWSISYTVDLIEPQIDRTAIDRSLTAKISGSPTDRTKPFENCVVTGGTGVRISPGGTSLYFDKSGWYEVDTETWGGTVTATPPACTYSSGISSQKLLCATLTNAGATLQRWTNSFFASAGSSMVVDFSGSMATIANIIARISGWSQVAMDDA